jgi:NAD(P)-dependent dehydrogenase (short-subunit alcohol dehydrogenase family)
MKLKGKTAIVTGVGAGIGESTARLFAKEGADVVGNDILEEARRVVDTIHSDGGSAVFVRGDVSLTDAARKIVETAIDTYGRLDILVNNAGIVLPGRVDNTSPEDWDRTMAVNVRGPYLLSKFAYPHLKESRGAIIHVASVAALMGLGNRAVYAASKGALTSLTRAMAMDYKDERIRVNCICPGTTDTPSLADRLSQLPNPEEARKQFIKRQPLGRLGTPDEIAEGILYLALADFCTGTILSVDGGMSL